MREKFEKFMRGRYGVDQLSLFITYFSVILLLILSFTNNGRFSFIPLLLVLYSYFRVFSKNSTARAKENAKFMGVFGGFAGLFTKIKRRLFGSKDYKYFTCTNCKTELRIPKHKGKIKVKCPKCKKEYIKRT